jgi:hypothetical protein
MKKMIFIALFAFSLQAAEMSKQVNKLRGISQLKAAISKIDSQGSFKKALIMIFGNTSDLALRETVAKELNAIIGLLQQDKIADALAKFEQLKAINEFKPYYEAIKVEIQKAIEFIQLKESTQEPQHEQSSAASASSSYHSHRFEQGCAASASSSSSQSCSSLTVVMFPIIAALLAPEGDFIPDDAQWDAINSQQTFFLKNFFSQKEELRNFSSKEIKAWASSDYNVLNKIARENGFDIQLNEFGPDEFGSLAIFDVLIEWLKKGSLTSIRYNDQVYQAAALTKDIYKIYGINNGIYPHPIVEIQTKSKDRVFMTIAASNDNLNAFNLVETINNLREIMRHVDSNGICRLFNYDSVVFPCVDLNQQVDISWLKGMRSNELYVNQALQQTKFKMDEKGARVQSSVMTSMARCMPLVLTINKPFYIWIERENCTIPVFMGYIDSSDWVRS